MDLQLSMLSGRGRRSACKTEKLFPPFQGKSFLHPADIAGRQGGILPGSGIGDGIPRERERGDGMSLVEVKNVRKVYRVGKEKIVALNHVTLSIEQGEICCILGTSGSGKSTLLNVMAGLERPTKGDILIGGVNIAKLSEKQLALFRQKNVGFVFQSYNLMPTQTAIENVAMPLMFRGVSKKIRTKEAIKMLKAVQLQKRMHHKPTQMSGGQQQRVGIARAFVAKPKIVFADEPTGNLDTHTTKDVMEIMVKMARKYHETLIIVTHDPEIAEYADRIVTLIDGDVRSDQKNISILPAEGEEPPQPQQSEQPQREPTSEAGGNKT